jgi:hypothetical protein
MEPAPQAAHSTATRRHLVGRAWEKIATGLAVIGLIDLTGQLIKWAAAVHWLVEKYRIVKVWLFGWMPFYIPPEWHDYVLLFCVMFSVVNVGFYRRTGKPFIPKLIRSTSFSDLTSDPEAGEYSGDRVAATLRTVALGFGIIGLLAYSLLSAIGWITGGTPPSVSVWVTSWSFIAIALSGAPLAWRWILVTGAIFAALIAINEIYILWLEPAGGALSPAPVQGHQ